MNFVNTAIQADAAQGSLKLRLHKHLLKNVPGRSMNNLHASDVTKSEFCPRRHAILTTLGHKQVEERMTLSMELTYSIGRMVQDQLVNWYADMGVAVGDWKCISCGKMHWFQKRPVSCPCGSKRFDPKEVRFLDSVNGASGGFDMLADLGEPKLRLVELKTMAPAEWEKLIMPLAEHRTRTNLYLRIVQQSNHPNKDKIDTTKATVMYVSKGGYGKADDTLKKYGMFDNFSPLKEFIIQHDPAITGPLEVKAKAFTDYRKGLAPMPNRCEACSEIMSKRAQACEAKVACFGQMFPPGFVNPIPVEIAP